MHIARIVTNQGREGNFCDGAISRGEAGGQEESQGAVAHPRKQPKRPGAADPAKFCLKPILPPPILLTPKTPEETTLHNIFIFQINMKCYSSKSCELKEGVILPLFGVKLVQRQTDMAKGLEAGAS